MARPQKTGLDYFSMDVDIEQDVKVRKLLKRKGGARALGVFVHILCQIYKNGYYADYNEDMVFVISENLYEEEVYVTDIIQYCLELGLLDKGMYEQFNVLTSHGIQARYRQVQQTFRRSSKIDRYNLVDDAQDTASSTKKQVSSEETRVNAAKTPVNAEETPVNAEETPNNDADCGNNPSFFGVSSPIGKENRKERKIKSSTTSPAREGTVGTGEVEGQREGIDSEIALLLGDEEWISSAASYAEVSKTEIPSLLKQFKNLCVSNGKNEHNDLSDLKQHFTSWLLKRKEHQNNSKPSSANGLSKQFTTSSDRRRGAPVPTGASQADFGGDF